MTHGVNEQQEEARKKEGAERDAEISLINHLSLVTCQDIGCHGHLSDGDVRAELLADNPIWKIADRGEGGENQFAFQTGVGKSLDTHAHTHTRTRTLTHTWRKRESLRSRPARSHTHTHTHPKTDTPLSLSLRARATFHV